MKLKYQIRPVSLFTTQTRRTPSNFVSRAFKSNSIPNCFASQYKIQARSSVNFEELWNPRLTRRDSWYVCTGFVKGPRVCEGRSNVICKLRDTPIPISIRDSKAGGHTQGRKRRGKERERAVYRVYDSCSTQFTMSPR